MLRNRTGRIAGLFLILVVFCLAGASAAAKPQEILLWPDGAPGAKGDSPGDKPTLTIYLPPKNIATGAAVVICPGGGYAHLAMDHEGHQVAHWLNTFGVAGFIVKYRHRNSGKGYGYPAPLLDVQRAIRMVRSRAKEWAVDTGRIGVMGFSAGGHLASMALTHFDNGNSKADNNIDKVGCRPNFGILIYPVISLTEWYTHKGSMRNLLGNNPSPKLMKFLSSEKQVTAQTPPTFLVSTWADNVVPAENSIAFYLALRKAKVPAEMHIFLKGPHGFGLGIPEKHGPVSNWPNLCRDWMKVMGFLKKAG